MSTGVYLLAAGGALEEMRESQYDSESLLQDLLARYPNLIAGDQVNSEAPRRWLLVSREMSVPDAQDGAGRWSLDHLFLDQDAVPTLVEVKRSTDTRLRREVVGQMLDYAANAVSYWPVESVRAQFERRCEREGLDPQEELARHLEPGTDPDGFWLNVKTNLHAGRLRLVFVADSIPTELQRIIEFLNGQMANTEVLGVAIQQFAGNGQRVFVPRVVGQTAAAQQQKRLESRPQRVWDEETFFAELQHKAGDQETIVARRILNWAADKNLRIWWGRGKVWGSFFPMVDFCGQQYWTVSVWTYGTIEVQYSMLAKDLPFSDEALRRELRAKLQQVPGVAISDGQLRQRPPIRMSLFESQEATECLLATLDWMVDTIRGDEPSI